MHRGLIVGAVVIALLAVASVDAVVSEQRANQGSRTRTLNFALVEVIWKWIGRIADVLQIGGLGVAIVVAAIVGNELELRQAAPVWRWGAAAGVFLIVAALGRWILRLQRKHFPGVGGTRFLSNRKIRLVDLVGQDSVIRDRTLEDCEIHGPMVVTSTGEGVGGFDRCTWNGNNTAVFIETEQQMVSGVVGLTNCVFRRCRFFNVAIMRGSAEAISDWKAGFGITSP